MPDAARGAERPESANAPGIPAGLRVVLHSLLAGRGGAARVADLLARGLAELGCVPQRTFERADGSEAASGVAYGAPCNVTEAARHALGTPKAETHAGAEPQGVLHLHATADWTASLTAARAALPPSARPLLTLHDARLLTGGCIHPLDCPGWRDGCTAPCPLNFPDAPAAQERLRAAVRATRPVLAAPSGWLARMVRQVFPDLGCHVVPNGVEWDAPEPAPTPSDPTPAASAARSAQRTAARHGLGIAPTARAVLFLAHGGERAAFKDGPGWPRIFERIAARVPRAVAVFAGGDRVKFDGRVLRLPYLKGARLRDLFLAADVLVYPSLADNHPLVILEAMACGLPVAASAVGGVPEQVRHGETGLLAAPGDRAALAEAAATLLADPALARRLGETARATGATRFTYRRMARGYLPLYRRALGLDPQ
ncbi:MAG: glycosyltransferase [Desulfovibrionaceae bacterium]|jgi:glycosyltransferase involved in cell wall biosynthesis|nr:glycosyltransferase [Desulfovibrionaceae bacterium]